MREEEEVWDELAVDAALPDQPHGAVPVRETAEEEEEEEMEVEGWDEDKEPKKAGRDTVEVILQNLSVVLSLPAQLPRVELGLC